MGVIISRFRRKKTTNEVLEKLERDIVAIETRGRWTQMQHQRVISHTTAYSVGIYVLFAVVYYFMYTGKSVSWFQSVMYATPFLLLPVLVILTRNTISWYYNRKLSKDRQRLNKMRTEKKKILEQVMETETYKVAKEILDKYSEATEPSKALQRFVPTTNVPGNSTPIPSATPGQLRQRQIALQNTPVSAVSPRGNNVSIVGNVGLHSPLRPELLPHPLVPNHQSAFDRVLNFFLNDGADKRFALICTSCSSHNGMVFEELYDFTSYKCAYCGKFNPSRKQRPRAPPLAITPARPQLSLSHVLDQTQNHDVLASSSSESEEENQSGTDGSTEMNRTDTEIQPSGTPAPPEDKKQD